MKTIQIILLFISINALQAQTIDKSSIDTGGASVNTATISVIYSIGEVVVQEYDTGNLKVSEGFINLVAEQNTLSISIKEDRHSLVMYPNPSKRDLTIKTKSNTIETISIVDINGRTVLQQTSINNTVLIIPTNTLSSGTYVLNILTSKGVVTKRFIKE